MPDVVLTRLLGEAAHRHVLDHAGAQRADGSVGKIAGHRGFLSRAEGCWTFDARDRMLRSSPPIAHRLARSPPVVTLAPARAGSFDAPRRTYALAPQSAASNDSGHSITSSARARKA